VTQQTTASDYAALDERENYARGYAAGFWDGERGLDLRVSGTSALPGYGEGFAKGWLDAGGPENFKKWPEL
jgi:hypothetical protein